VRRAALLAAAVTAATLVACGSGQAPVSGAALDGEALAGTVGTVDGGSLDLAAYRGGVLVIWFWAPW
jgi:hypothetical protein